LALACLFVIVAGYRLFAGEADCGCFGNVRVHPLWTLLLDVTVLFGLYGARSPKAAPRHARPEISAINWRVQLGRALAVSLVFPAAIFGLAQLFYSSRVVVTDAQSWPGRLFPMLEFVEVPYRADLTSGRRTVILYNHDCDSCTAYLARLARLPRSPEDASAIRLMDVNPVGPDRAKIASSPFQESPLRRGTRYVVNVPTEVTLMNGVVERIRAPE
jgi:hypothetical protein